MPMNEPGYEHLADVLQRAYDQAARGKGRERHANDKAFHLQPMQDLIRLHGVGFATGQASKKASEALGLPTLERQVAELLGAIVYLSGAVIALEAESANKSGALTSGKVVTVTAGGGPAFPPVNGVVGFACSGGGGGPTTPCSCTGTCSGTNGACRGLPAVSSGDPFADL